MHLGEGFHDGFSAICWFLFCRNKCAPCIHYSHHRVCLVRICAFSNGTQKVAPLQRSIRNSAILPMSASLRPTCTSDSRKMGWKGLSIFSGIISLYLNYMFKTSFHCLVLQHRSSQVSSDKQAGCRQLENLRVLRV